MYMKSQHANEWAPGWPGLYQCITTSTWLFCVSLYQFHILIPSSSIKAICQICHYMPQSKPAFRVRLVVSLVTLLALRPHGLLVCSVCFVPQASSTSHRSKSVGLPSSAHPYSPPYGMCGIVVERQTRR